MANIREVAQAADVSPSTVSRVLRGTVPVSEEVRQRVIKAAARLHYKQPESPRSGDYHIGIIVPRSSAEDLPGHATLYGVITWFVAELDKRKVHNSMVVIDDTQLKNIETFFTKKLNGYLVAGTSQEQEDVLMPFLNTLQCPWVIVNRRLDDPQVNSVVIDDIQASITATRHLISLKHRRIAFVGGDENFRNSKLRLAGFKTACKEAGIFPPPEYIIQGKYTAISGYEAAAKLFALKSPPTAAFFTSDVLAIGCQQALQERNIAMPGAFAMVGFGDIPLSSYVSPKLTTIRMPTEEMGQQSALILLNLIQNPLVAFMQITVNSPLIIRESCGSKISLSNGEE
jgi:DNA-binding LacI/PurR family transcriptional regulator